MSGHISPFRLPFTKALRSPFGIDGNLTVGDPLLRDVLALYANGEQGALYYFTEDFAGLYQDAAGTTPVTAVGQPVGLMLDRRFGLARGGEIAPSTSSGWSSADARWTYSANSISWVGQGGTNGGTAIDVTPIGADKVVELRFTISGWSGTGNGGVESGVLSRVPNDKAASALIDTRVTGNGTYTFIGYFRGTGGGNRVQLLGRGTMSFTISNISIREIPGNHASQPTTTARPLLQRDANGKLHLAFDGVDDLMMSSVPAGMPANVYLAAAVNRNAVDVATPFFRAVSNSGANDYADLYYQSAGRGVLRSRALSVGLDIISTPVGANNSFPLNTPVVAEGVRRDSSALSAFVVNGVDNGTVVGNLPAAQVLGTATTLSFTAGSSYYGMLAVWATPTASDRTAILAWLSQAYTGVPA